jgi:hypothetical protein
VLMGFAENGRIRPTTPSPGKTGDAPLGKLDRRTPQKHARSGCTIPKEDAWGWWGGCHPPGVFASSESSP